MGKKGEKGDEDAAAGSASAEILALKAQIQQVEELVQAQTLQLKSDMKSDMASSQTKLQSDIKDQLDDFFTKFVRLQSRTPPPQVVTIEAGASNLGQLSDRHSAIGENSPLYNAFSVSPISHMQFSKPGPSNPIGLTPTTNQNNQTTIVHISPHIIT
jgi:hypothetical protein